jgi:hypothetical protein
MDDVTKMTVRFVSERPAQQIGKFLAIKKDHYSATVQVIRITLSSIRDFF